MRDKSGRLLIVLGLVLILSALLLAGYNLADAGRAGETASRTAEVLVSAAEEHRAEFSPDKEVPADPGEILIPDHVLDPERQLPVVSLDGRDYVGIIEIPAIGLELPVIAEWSYGGLKEAPCRYSGSPYTGGFVIAGHNYTAHLGRISELRQGDEVLFTDMDGSVFSYTVSARETLPPRAVEEMTAPEWDLSLFTCTLAGTARVTVRCLADGE